MGQYNSLSAAIASRMRALRPKGATQADVAKALGMSRSYLSELESGLKEPSASTLQRVSAYYGVSIDHLVNGASMSFIANTTIPLLDQRVAAGPLEAYVDQSPEVEHIDLPDMPKGQGWLAVRAHGDSMEPTIIDGDILICRKVNPYEFENNRVYVVEIVGEGYHVKRVLRLTREARLLLKSDNRARPNTSYSNEQVGSIYEVKRRITYDLSGPEGVYERLSQHEVMLHELNESIQRLIANKQS